MFKQMMAFLLSDNQFVDLPDDIDDNNSLYYELSIIYYILSTHSLLIWVLIISDAHYPT